MTTDVVSATLRPGLVRPPLREKVKEKFNRGAASQQFLV